MSATRRSPKAPAPPRDGHGGPDRVDPGERRDGHGPATGGRAPDRSVDPRAVRVGVAATMPHIEAAQLIVEPPPTPLAPTPRVLGVGILGGVAERPPDDADAPGTVERRAIVDGEPTDAVLVHLDASRATLRPGGPADTPIRVLLEPAEVSTDGRGVSRREVVIDGWRIELDVESERRAALRDRARRGREESARGGPTEVHAIIPGRVVSVSIAPGDAVVASQQLLVVEAMKMQNELHSPRDGTVVKVGVAPGDTIEIGDLLLVLE